MPNYYQQGFGPRSSHTPQTQPIPGQSMVLNHAGGYSYKTPAFTQFRRWLILGSTVPTYYVGRRELTRENITVLEELLKEGHGKFAIDEIVRVSEGGLAASNDTALFALARCAACDVHGKHTIPLSKGKTYTLHAENHLNLFSSLNDGETKTLPKKGKVFRREGDVIYLTTQGREGTVEVVHPDDIAIRQYAFAALSKVARIGTHILHFVSYLDQFRGWGHAARRAVGNWFLNKRESSLALQLIKYQERDKWRQRDLLRLAHPKAKSPIYNDLFHWATKGWESVGSEPHSDPTLGLLWAFETAKRSEDPCRIADLIRQYNLPRECVPTQSLQSPIVWDALLTHMGTEAMVRNLAKMTRTHVLDAERENRQVVLARLRDRERIHADRLHPMKILSALRVYSYGKSLAGDATWEPIGTITDALSDAFYLAFDNVEATGKRILLIVDVSGSMHHRMINNHLRDKDASKNEFPGMTMHQGAAAMAMLLMKTEPNCQIIGVDTALHQLRITPADRMDRIAQVIARYGGGGTSLELPIEHAISKRIELDAFVCITDSESWSGSRHIVQSLAQYRSQINKDAKWIHMQMAPTYVTTSSPNDPLSFDLVGFDTSIPSLVRACLLGDI